MPYDIYGQPLRHGYCEAHPDCRGTFGECEECVSDHRDPRCDLRGSEMDPPYYPEEECANAGHPYHGDDCDLVYGGRCYCGERRYPKAVQPTPPAEMDAR